MIPKVPGKVEVSPFCMVWGYKINDSYPAAIYTTVGIVCPFFFSSLNSVIHNVFSKEPSGDK